MTWIIAGISIVGMAVIIFLVSKITAQLNQQLNSVTQQLNDRLKEVTDALLDTHKTVGDRLDSATRVFGDVQKSLGRVEQTHKQIYEVSKDIASLQDLLRAPKFRGQMGETMLENLLSLVMPKEHFQMQYRFKSGDAVDAIIKIGERIVPVDAKFTLENFQKILDTQDEEAKNVHRKKFIQDVKNRIDEISSKYILPQENTYDFALMYIPAENVYYELIIKEDLLSYCVSKRVIPVSPNTFYAYLQVICLGLKGMKVEENAKEILKNLGMLSNEIGKFEDDFGLLGKHLTSASQKYDDSQKKLEKFSDKLSNIQNSKRLELK